MTKKVLEIRIPAPAEWINSNQRLHRMQTAKLTKAWRTASRAASAGLGPLQTPVSVIAYIWKPRNGRYDPGNLYPTAKAILDGLVDSGLIEDDDHTRVIGPDMRHGGKGAAEIVLKISEIRDPTHERRPTMTTKEKLRHLEERITYLEAELRAITHQITPWKTL